MREMKDIFTFFYETDADTYVEYDADGKMCFEVTRNQLIHALITKKSIQTASFNVAPKDVKMFLTDCDGCLTDGGMYYSENGDELKKFNTKDGMGFSMLKKRGIIVGIVTGEDRELNRRRAAKLKLDILESGCTDKLATVKKLCQEFNCSLNQVVYIGDDINDLEVIQNVGFSCCPQNAVESVRKAADMITGAKGGEGVIREVVDYLLERDTE